MYLLCILSLLFVVRANAEIRADFSCNAGGPVYGIYNGQALFNSSLPLRVFSNGAWQNAWSKIGERDLAGYDALGSYAATECSYAVQSQPGIVFIILRVFTYPLGGIVRFEYTLPLGLTSTNHSVGTGLGANVDDDLPGALFSTITNFPGFNASVSSLSNVLTWHESFVTPDTAMTSAYGMRGGPVVLYGSDITGNVAIISPLDSFLESAFGDDTAAGPCASPGCLTAGISSTFESLPPGFTQSFIIVAGTGITATIATLGSSLQAWYSSTAPKLDDLSLTTLGYQTDNGAQLCFGCKGPLDACLLGEKAYLVSIAVPIQYLSFQNAWWNMGNQSAPWCVGSWDANGRVPMGVPAFQKAFGLPFQLYAPYFCSDTAYLANWSMVRSDNTLPGCQDFDFYDAAPEDSRAFYEFLFDIGQSYGMFSFEPDFLNQNHNCQPRFIHEVGAAAAFFGGQASVGLDRGIPIQWCFATPYVLLWTLTAPAVTNFRASMDFYYGSSWDIGTSSLLVWAAGGAPSKDTFWTSDNGNQSTTRGGCDKTGCPPDHSNAGAELHTMLALFSTGPMGFSDAPGETDAVLLSRACDSNGTLLKPSRPITSVDSTFDVTHGAAPQGGYVLGTHTTLYGPGGESVTAAHFIVSHQLSASFALRGADVWPPMAPAQPYVVVDWRLLLACSAGNGSAAAACGVTNIVAPADGRGPVATLPSVPHGVDPFTPTLTLIIPVCPAAGGGIGAALLGEPDKFATVSVRRFVSSACTAQGLAFVVAGQPGETVRLAVLAWGAQTVSVLNATLPATPGDALACTLEGSALSCAPQAASGRAISWHTASASGSQ